MDNNNVLRRIRYIFDFNDSRMISIFHLGGLEVTRAKVSDWLKRDDDPAYIECEDIQLASFLNGLIIHKRGKKEGPEPESEKFLSNNLILKKIRIALALKSDDILDIMASIDFPMNKPELSSYFPQELLFQGNLF